MRTWHVSYAVLVLLVTFTLFLSNPSVFAVRCQISNVSYGYPQQAAPSQRILITSTLAGSCVSNGEDYYSVRVDIVDTPSGSIVSSNSTPIGYNATNFTVTTDNMPTTPGNNGTWHVGIDVYVIRAGGTGGSYLLDYKAVGNATIQLGPPAAIPEFPSGLVAGIVTALCSSVLVIDRRRRPRAHKRA